MVPRDGPRINGVGMRDGVEAATGVEQSTISQPTTASHVVTVGSLLTPFGLQKKKLRKAKDRTKKKGRLEYRTGHIHETPRAAGVE